MDFFTADWHFDDQNIIEYCNRPFKNVNEMNNEIINKFNERITNNDDVYILGDLIVHTETNLQQLEKYIRKMNGNKILILGNHDRFKPFEYIDIGFQSVHTYFRHNKFHLVHDPACSIIDIYNHWCVGHIHTLFKEIQRNSSNVMNVGVDVWDFYPIGIDDFYSGELKFMEKEYKKNEKLADQWKKEQEIKK